MIILMTDLITMIERQWEVPTVTDSYPVVTWDQAILIPDEVGVEKLLRDRQRPSATPL